MRLMEYIAVIRRSLGQTVKQVLAKPNETRKAIEDVTDLLKKHNSRIQDIRKAMRPNDII